MDVEGSCTDDFTGDRHVVEDRKMGIRQVSRKSSFFRSGSQGTTSLILLIMFTLYTCSWQQKISADNFYCQFRAKHKFMDCLQDETKLCLWNFHWV